LGRGKNQRLKIKKQNYIRLQQTYGGQVLKFKSDLAVAIGWGHKVYKYMRIYLWTSLRIMVLRVMVFSCFLDADCAAKLSHR